MKKLIQKLRTPKGATPAAARTPTRITSDTLEEHRQKVLAGGRKFKYPLQYAKHRLVFNTIIISVFALVTIIGLGWWQLYAQQNTSAFMYRVTTVLPLPAGTVDGEMVRYSDYLMKFRSAEYYLRNKEQATLTGEDGERQISYLKQNAMRDAVADSYATKLAKEKNLTISDEELANFLLSQRQSADGEISERTYYTVIQDYYNWGADEYLHAMRIKLLRQKIAYAIDETATKGSKQVYQAASTSGAPWNELATTLAASEVPGAEYGASGFVPKTNQDGGLALAASKLEVGQISQPIQSLSADGYYIVRTVALNDTQVSYEYIKVPLTAFTKQVSDLYSANKVKLFIAMPEEQASEQK